MKMYKYVIALFVLSLVGCGPKVAPQKKQSRSSLDFISFGENQSASFKAMRSAEFKLCINDQNFSGNKALVQENAKIGLLTWYRAIRQIDPSIKNNIKIDCKDSDIDVNVYDGGGRSRTDDYVITLQASNGDGSILHEFGHAFARLSDTYDTQTGQAGACVQGQQKSVMCYGQYGKHDNAGHALLYQDDVDGIQDNYKKMFPEFANAVPDKSIDATGPLDLQNPWPAAGGGGGQAVTGVFAMLADSSVPNAADIYVSAPNDTQSVALCVGNAATCSVPNVPTIGSTSTKLPGITDRLVFKSMQVPMYSQGLISFIVTDKSGKKSVAKTVVIKSKT